MSKTPDKALKRIEEAKRNNSTQLYLRNCGLTQFPSEILELTNLTELDLRDNKLTTLPETFGNLTNLTELLLSRNQLTTAPEPICKLINLTRLFLNDNQLTTLSESIEKLTNLTFLDLMVNQLTTLPESIGKLTNLKSLFFNDNKLTTLPESMGKLINLTILELDNNQFQVGAEIYELGPKEQIEEILKWQRAQKAGTLQPIHEAKVIFIGESNYGKTHLIELLQKGKIKRKIKTTHGIERSQITIPYTDKNIRLNIWDLGGQEFMRSTHQFFFSERTLYVLVTLARRERNELNHWLKLANELGNEAPVLVVINKIDLDPHDLDRKSLERDEVARFVKTILYFSLDALPIHNTTQKV